MQMKAKEKKSRARGPASSVRIPIGQAHLAEYDEVVIRLNEEALAKLHCEKELKIVPRATHLFEEEGALEQVAQLAASWFRRHLRPCSSADQ